MDNYATNMQMAAVEDRLEKMERALTGVEMGLQRVMGEYHNILSTNISNSARLDRLQEAMRKAFLKCPTCIGEGFIFIHTKGGEQPPQKKECGRCGGVGWLR